MNDFLEMLKLADKETIKLLRKEMEKIISERQVEKQEIPLREQVLPLSSGKQVS